MSPTIGLDVSMKAKIRSLISGLNHEKNTTVILTTHDMGDVDALCKRIVIIDKGQKIYDNDISHLKNYFGSYRTLRLKTKGGVWEEQLIDEKHTDIMKIIMNFAAATCFWIQGSGYVMVILFRFKDFAKYPATIFHGFFKFVFTFIIPVAFIAYYPSMALLAPDDIPLLTILAPFIGILFFYLSYKFWMLGVRRYDFTGS